MPQVIFQSGKNFRNMKISLSNCKQWETTHIIINSSPCHYILSGTHWSAISSLNSVALERDRLMNALFNQSALINRVGQLLYRSFTNAKLFVLLHVWGSRLICVGSLKLMSTNCLFGFLNYIMAWIFLF